MIPDSNGEVYITNSSDGPLGSEFITVDNFKISAGGGKSTVTVRNHVNQSTDKDFTIKVVGEEKIDPLMIITPDVSVPEKTEKVITLM
jgi:hypothetical protein